MSVLEPLASVSCDPDIAGKRLLILGGGLWQQEYVRRSRALGAEVWLTDWSESAVARADADHFAPIDLRDREGTLAFARGARVDAILTAADVGVPTAAYVAAALGLPGPTLELAVQATNKWAMRRVASQAGLASPWFERVTDGPGAVAKLGGRPLPVIVKPTDNCSSRGVQVVRSHDELLPAVEAALQASASGEALIEQFIEGREGSVEVLVQDGEAIILGVCDKTKSRLPDRFDLELRYPGAYPTATRDRIEAFAGRLAHAFHVTNAILHIEFLLVGDADEVVLIEFALRGCGSKVITHLLPAVTGRDVVRAIVRQAFGVKTVLPPAAPRHGVLHFLMFPPGRVHAIRGVDEARSVPGVIDLTIERAVGDRIEAVHDGRSRPGHLLAHGESREAVQAIVSRVRQLVRLDYEERADVAPVPMQGIAAQ